MQIVNNYYSFIFSKKIYKNIINNCVIQKNSLKNNINIQDKKIITISPAGYNGFYQLGICKYIKENYNLDNFVFSGASAGSWNSLLMCYKGNIHEIQNKIIDDKIQNIKTMIELENDIKNKLLYHYKTEDFDFNKLFIGVTTIKGIQIFNNFDNLEDAINCCVASSHIPFITGGVKYTYKNVLSFDGGFSKFPYLYSKNIVLNINPNLWNNNKKNYSFKISDYTTIFSKDKFNFISMIENGYKDCEKNKQYLDNIFMDIYTDK